MTDLPENQFPKDQTGEAIEFRTNVRLAVDWVTGVGSAQHEDKVEEGVTEEIQEIQEIRDL